MVKVSFNGMGLPNTLCDASYDTAAAAYRCTSDPFLVDGDTDDNLDSTTGVDYNELGQVTEMRFPAGGNLWRHNLYYKWDDSAWGGFSNSEPQPAAGRGARGHEHQRGEQRRLAQPGCGCAISTTRTATSSRCTSSTTAAVPSTPTALPTTTRTG